MKHTLKFRTANLYTKDSDFLFNAIIVLLYLIPISLILWQYWFANYHKKLAEQLFEAENKLQGYTQKYKASINKLKPNSFDEISLEKKYENYSILLSACNTSWTSILERLENITPDQIRFQRISIRPDKELKIKLEGKTKNINFLTNFLREIYSSKHFINPILKNHRKVNLKNASENEIAFSLELTYVEISNEEGDKE